MSDLRAAVGELQRVTSQLEESIDEQGDYSSKDRTALAAALSDLAVRIELVRCQLLDPEKPPESKS